MGIAAFNVEYQEMEEILAGHRRFVTRPKPAPRPGDAIRLDEHDGKGLTGRVVQARVTCVEHRAAYCIIGFDERMWPIDE
jgi:hypothetical protein